MHDLWILAFMFRGVVATAGDAMPLKECEQRAKDIHPSATQPVCINVHAPTCRVYRDANPLTKEATEACRGRTKRYIKATLL